ncbi:hypothetical protein HID58_069845, partial [Brassica napus]
MNRMDKDGSYEHFGGLRINPKLYNCGKCQSLLGTWSVQGLIFNEKPYFNKFGCEGTSGSPRGEAQSTAFNVCNMRRPPKVTKNKTHSFTLCAHDVLKKRSSGGIFDDALRIYLKKGKRKGERCPEKFREDVGTLLLKEFILLGVLGL